MFFQGPFKHSTTRTRAHFGSTTRARALCHLHTKAILWRLLREMSLGLTGLFYCA